MCDLGLCVTSGTVCDLGRASAQNADVLNTELLSRSHQSIENFKPEIAQSYFAPVVGEDQSEEEPTNETN